MEEHENKVIKSLANQSQNISKSTSEYTQKSTLRYKGGGAWGGLPLRSLLAAVFGPPR